MSSQIITPKENLKDPSVAFHRHGPSCNRCQGLLVRVRFMDMLNSGSLWGMGWRCINCGSIIDTVIRSNQRRDLQAETPRKVKRRRARRLIAA